MLSTPDDKSSEIYEQVSRALNAEIGTSRNPGNGNGRPDILERIAHAQISKQKQLAEGNQPPAKRIKLEVTAEPIALHPVTTGQFLAQDKTLGGPVDPKIRSFFTARNHTSPPIMDALDASGFTSYELLTMKGQEKQAIMERFKIILGNYRWRPAQIESLSYAVSRASASEWRKLKNDTFSASLEPLFK